LPRILCFIFRFTVLPSMRESIAGLLRRVSG